MSTVSAPHHRETTTVTAILFDCRLIDVESHPPSSGHAPKPVLRSLVASGGLVSYGLTKIFLSVTSFLTHLSPTVIAKWGFYTGFGTASLIGGGALLAADVLYIRARPRVPVLLVQNPTSRRSPASSGRRFGTRRSAIL